MNLSVAFLLHLGVFGKLARGVSQLQFPTPVF